MKKADRQLTDERRLVSDHGYRDAIRGDTNQFMRKRVDQALDLDIKCAQAFLLRLWGLMKAAISIGQTPFQRLNAVMNGAGSAYPRRSAISASFIFADSSSSSASVGDQPPARFQ